MLTAIFKVGLGLAVIFLGVRVGGDLGHYLQQSLLNQTPSGSALS